MKKLTSLVISCSLLLAGTALAQSDDQPDPKHKKSEKDKDKNEEKRAAEEKHASSEAKHPAPPAPKAEKPAERKAPVAPQEDKHTDRKAPDAVDSGKSDAAVAAARKRAAAVRSEKSAEPATHSPDAARPHDKAPSEAAVEAAKKHAKAQADRSDKNASNDRAEKDQADRAAKADREVKADREAQDNRQAKAARNTSADPRPDANADRPKTRKSVVKRPPPAKIEEIRARHENFRAEARPDRVPTVTFSEDRRIENSDRWHGPQYEVFRSYRPERHDEHYYRTRYDRVELIGGGYYYLNNGYWYPAWGYRPSEEYYAYDGPVYAGKRAVPPDRIIADVQDSLQDLGYYKGEVDGLLGPLTRAALTGYQDDQGLEITAAIDEPTLDQLGLN